MEKILRNVNAVLFDLDGTLYVEDKPIGNASDTLKFLREKGIKIIFLSNNSSKTIDEYEKKLRKLDLFNEGDGFYSSLDAAIDYLNDRYVGEKVYPVCTEKVKKFIEGKGVKTSAEASVVLLCYDKELTYKKLVEANALISKGATYIATHPDVTCPAKDVYEPDVGSFIQLFKASSNREPQAITGKPSKIMGEYLLKNFSLTKERTLMVGDRLYTDIAFGVNNGFKTALVLSGETDEASLARSSVKPTVVLNTVDDLKGLF